MGDCGDFPILSGMRGNLETILDPGARKLFRLASTEVDGVERQAST